MKKLTIVFLSFVWSFAAVADEKTDIAAILDGYHMAASKGDWDTYFDLMADNSVFLGTDITERWTKPEFKAYTETRPNGWSYVAKERNVDLAPDGKSAWFDEIMYSETYGYCRGTGALIRTENGWKITQYHMTFPIPNDVFFEITKQFQDLVTKQVTTKK